MTSSACTTLRRKPHHVMLGIARLHNLALAW
jgi:hypothetical protein